MKINYIFVLLLCVSSVSAFFTPVNGGNSSSDGTFFGYHVLVLTAPFTLTTVINCAYQTDPKTFENNLFICQLENAYGKTFNCNGITKDPANDNVLSISPDVASIKDVGVNNAYLASPVGASTQYVKVLMPSDRLRRGEATKFEVKCVNNLSSSSEYSYSAEIVPDTEELEVLAEGSLSVKNYAGYYIMGFFGLVVIGIVGLWLWRKR